MFFILLLVSQKADCADWYKIRDTASLATLIDRESIVRQDDGTIRFHYKVIYAQEDKLDYSIHDHEVRCASKTERFLASEYHYRDGQVRKESGSDIWEIITTGSITDEFHIILCPPERSQ
jgi:hypothetical protein